ncbi:putative halogenase [Gymnopus androsaceus JB14]|uniref:Halogenase n=1 Tax=Gymnopus androsaceus JB14 TaxID=1447944 RepID=A0A6A4IHW3_9AGAR|nr:putative halogenase [Gymnopus androsaceus JB14]
MGIPVVPRSTKILVIGGGPAGAYTASILAREGLEVTVLEKDYFPRYHIGESMLPSFNAFLDFVDAKEKVKKCGFVMKPGAAIKLNQYKREGYTNFIQFNLANSAWNVLRSEFDEFLLQHAAECGARVFNGVAISEIQFSGTDKNVPVSASWTSKYGQTGTISFEWLVDASGRNGIMSTKYLKNRRFNESLRNIATWGYWTGAGVYSPGTDRENAPWFEALTDESGWAWFIPLHNGTVSVGVVISEKSNSIKKSQLQVDKDKDVAHYHNQLFDYSYSAEMNHYAGPHYRIAGDAGAFIDPLFSSGVHLAFTGGLVAAATIKASIKGDCTEDEAIAFHNAKIGTSYTRFLVVVWAVYRQIKTQSAPILSEVDEDNFDRAFDFLRPVIQGGAEADPRLTEDELSEALEFCGHGVGPASPDLFESVSRRIDPALLTPSAPLMSGREVDALVGEDDEAKQVLRKHNSNKALSIAFDYQNNFRNEILNGMYVHLEKGALGLRRV